MSLTVHPVLAFQARPTAATRAESYTFAFRDADVAQVVEEVVGGALGVTYTLDPAITGKMSFRIDQRLTRPQLFEAIEAALAANDIALVREGESVRIVPRAKARMSSNIRAVGDVGRRAGYDVVAVPLSYASPSEVAKALESMTASNTVLYTSDKQGLLILGGIGTELQSALETIKVFDRSAFEGSRIRWFELGQAPAVTVAGELDRLLQAGGMGSVTIVPLKRLNGLIVFARTTQALDDVGRWVTRLDVVSRESASSLYVYRPRSSSAEDLGATLGSVISGQNNEVDNGARGNAALGETAGTTASSSTAAAAPPGTSGGAWSSGRADGDDAVRIGVNKASNSLLIFAAPSRWIQIQRILDEIDRPASQVLIEASILEVRLSNDLKYGVDWSVLGDSGKLGVNSIYNDKGAIGPSFPGFSVTYLTGDIKAAVSALGSKTDVEVVSAPKIVTLDNHPAKLQIGDQVPIVTQSSQSTAGGTPALINTVDYRNTGVILNVTPRITGDNRVVLDVAQEVSSVAKTITSGIDSPTIQQRKFESTLVLDNGSVVALGGLISRSRTHNDVGMPGLSKVPYLGALFKSDSRDEARSELIVLLTARIITDQTSADRTMANLLADLHEIQTRGLVPSRQ
ncbi:hypothetical protein ASD79_16035 [Caulobacter sp. Root655]|uniref:type II secretion system secretin GspD n=1 Tax=Caulobacter sp. Root655 TaxID=1736578 RepID=UPI0006F66CFA|nr:type II secretion system secretin GspD [Caulobacter sp. Root655]KRA57822.1 hypothetical protein ASD79_16035 [Caulobacter sp. Root655]